MLKEIRRGMGLLFLAWTVVRFIPDQIESFRSLEKYAKWAYLYLGAPHGLVWTLLILVVGIGLIFSETIEHKIRQWTKTSSLGLAGDADIMIQELDISDLEISRDWSYVVNLALFVRMEITSLDKPRTVKDFEIEMTAPDSTIYRAKSQYELGAYEHVHDVEAKDNWGMATFERIREPMADLAAKARTPIQPGTHLGRAWARFEIPQVKQGHEHYKCRFKIFAVDPAGERYRIATDGMRIIGLDAREYATARGR